MECEVINKKDKSCIIKFTAENNEDLTTDSIKHKITIVVNKINNGKKVNKVRDFGDNKEMCIAVIYE